MLNQPIGQFNPSQTRMVAQFISSKEITTKAKSVSNRIKSLLRDGRLEYKYAKTARDLVLSGTPGGAQTVMASIAAWHYKNAAEQFRSAAEALRFTSVIDLSDFDRRYIDLKRTEFEELGKTLERKASEISADSNADAVADPIFHSAVNSNN